MKKRVILLCTLGLVCVIASPIEQTYDTEINIPLSENESLTTQKEEILTKEPFDDPVVKQATDSIETIATTESSVKYDDANVDITIVEETYSPDSGVVPQIATSNQDDTEQKQVTDPTNTNTTPESSVKQDDRDVHIIIEETYSPPSSVVPQIDTYLDDVPESDIIDNLYRNGIVSNIQGEIMETAEGFSPFTLSRKRQKARRRFATRRHFGYNPHRRPYYYHYPTYRRWYPSSLRYY